MSYAWRIYISRGFSHVSVIIYINQRKAAFPILGWYIENGNDDLFT